MNMRDLASFAGGTRRPHDHCHPPDSRHVEPDPLAAPQSRSLDDLDFRELAIPVTDPINRLGAEKYTAPELASFKFRSCDNAAKYTSTAPAARGIHGADR
jgi:hypothetical protein